jgi:hypothetical protein
VPDAELAAGGAPGHASQVAIRRHVMQLRSRLRHLDLSVRRVPGQGYVLKRRR